MNHRINKNKTSNENGIINSILDKINHQKL